MRAIQLGSVRIGEPLSDKLLARCRELESEGAIIDLQNVYYGSNRWPLWKLCQKMCGESLDSLRFFERVYSGAVTPEARRLLITTGWFKELATRIHGCLPEEVTVGRMPWFEHIPPPSPDTPERDALLWAMMSP